MDTTTRTTRRLFFVKAGAVAAAPVAAATGFAADDKPSDGDALKRLALLEDVNAIRDLQRSVVQHVNSRSLDCAQELFADGVSPALSAEIRSLSPDARVDTETVEVAADRKSATARLLCEAIVETPIGPSCTLVEMARGQGEGMLRRATSGVLESALVNRNGVWKIARLTYRA